jgi:hypothetical protein
MMNLWNMLWGTAACFNLYLATRERFSRNTAH